MDSLRRAAETRLGEQQMANHPCGLGPSLGVLLDPEQVNEPVEVRLEVGPLKHRAGERGEPGPAGAAAPALDPSGGPPVPEGRGRAAGGAGGVGAVEVGGLGEGAEAVLLAAAPLVDGPADELEVPLVELRDGVREGAVSVHLGVPVRSGAHPAGLSPNKSRVGSAANSRLAGTG